MKNIIWIKKNAIVSFEGDPKFIANDSKYYTNTYKSPILTLSILNFQGPIFILSKVFLSNV